MVPAQTLISVAMRCSKIATRSLKLSKVRTWSLLLLVWVVAQVLAELALEKMVVMVLAKAQVVLAPVQEALVVVA